MRTRLAVPALFAAFGLLACDASKEELEKTKTTLAEVQKHPHGAFFPTPEVVVAERFAAEDLRALLHRPGRDTWLLYPDVPAAPAPPAPTGPP